MHPPLAELALKVLIDNEYSRTAGPAVMRAFRRRAYPNHLSMHDGECMSCSARCSHADQLPVAKTVSDTELCLGSLPARGLSSRRSGQARRMRHNGEINGNLNNRVDHQSLDHNCNFHPGGVLSVPSTVLRTGEKQVPGDSWKESPTRWQCLAPQDVRN